MIKATSDYGLIIRTQSLGEHDITPAKLCETLQFEAAYDQNSELISFGPSFGQEALEEFISRLENIGLRYWDDFFEFKGDYPNWVRFYVELNSTGT